MSVTRTYKPEIKIPEPQIRHCNGNIRGTPCMQVLELALKKIVKERGGELTSGYRDCRGAHQATVLGITTPGLPRGLGVDVDWKSGRVIFRYDAEGANRGEAERLCRDISWAYAVVAVLQAHASLGIPIWQRSC